MAYTLKISDVLKETNSQYAKIVSLVLEKMAVFAETGFRNPDGALKSYQDYAPHLDFGQQYTRSMIGNALGEIWSYCSSEGIPWLNMLVVRKDTQLPGEGVFSWYEETFNTLAGFEKYCEYHISQAEHMLTHKLIVILP